MLAGEKELVTVLRTIKSVILDAEIAANKRDTGLEEPAVIALLQKESKKRAEAAGLYDQGGDAERAANERSQKAIIDTYLPAMLDEAAVGAIVDEVMQAMGPVTPADMGKIIGAAKAKTGPAGDGALIARLVKERLTS